MWPYKTGDLLIVVVGSVVVVSSVVVVNEDGLSLAVESSIE